MRTPLPVKHSDVVDHSNQFGALPRMPGGETSLKLSRIRAALLPDAKSIANAHEELLAEFALRDEHGNPVHPIDGKGNPIESAFRMDPARRVERMAKERTLLDGVTTYELELLTEAEVVDVFKRCEITPAAGASLLAFVMSSATPEAK